MPKIILNKQPIKTSFCTAVLYKLLPILVGLSLCTLNPGQLSASTITDHSDLNAETVEVLAKAYTSDPCTTPSCTYSYSSGSCSNYTVNTGETLCILGDYTSCSVTLAGGTVYIAPGVTFAPTMGGTIQGTIINCGNSVFNAVSFSPGSTVQNFGNMSFSGSINLNGNVDFINDEGAELNFDSNFSLDQSSTLVSDGLVSITGSFIVKNGTSFTNNFELEITGNFTTDNGGTTINNGRVTSSGGDININTGASVINNCSFSATNHIIINEDLENNGLLYSLGGVGNITINNAATLTNNGDVVSNSLTINGSAEGSGAFWQTGNTYLNSGGSFGADGQGLNIHDSSTPPGAQFFDIQNGLLHGSATNNSPSSSNPIPSESDLATTCSVGLRFAAGNCSSGVDSDGDGVSDICDLDDDNDGIPDTDECPGLSSGLTGPLMSFTTDISTTDATDVTTPHILNSITYAGETYSDFIIPSSFTSNYSITNDWGIRYFLNSTQVFNYGTVTDYDTDILPAFTSRNLGAYQGLDNNDFSDGDYYDLGYANPVISNSGGFIAITERLGNNPQIVSALDENGVVFGSPITVGTSDYVDLGVSIRITTHTSNAFMALYPIDDLAPVGSQIHGLRISFGPTATSDGPDAKVFIFGSSEALACDADNDGVPNYLDLDSDNDGIYDLIESGHAATDANNDGVIDGNPSAFGTNGLFDGIETSADSDAINYNISDSESKPDGIYDAYEIDADGDGCFDTVEENISDSEEDGTAGTGTPTVSSTTGLVNGLTYGPPVNNTWTNPLSGPCLTEICGDNIDNDADGLTDFEDSECDICNFEFESEEIYISKYGNSACGDDILVLNWDANSLSVNTETNLGQDVVDRGWSDIAFTPDGNLYANIPINFDEDMELYILNPETGEAISSVCQLDGANPYITQWELLSDADGFLYTVLGDGTTTALYKYKPADVDNDGFCDDLTFVVDLTATGLIGNGDLAWSNGTMYWAATASNVISSPSKVVEINVSTGAFIIHDLEDEFGTPLTEVDAILNDSRGNLIVGDESNNLYRFDKVDYSLTLVYTLTQNCESIGGMASRYEFRESETCPEVCGDGLDNDADGLTDCQDCSDCASSVQCGDNDGDGIGDYCDLDDDNDGIPDLDECPTTVYGPELIVNGDFEDGYAHWTSFFNRGRNNHGPTSDGCGSQGWVAVSGCSSNNGNCPTYYDYNGSTPTGSTLITDPFGTGANVIPTQNCNSTFRQCEAAILPDHTTGTGLSVYVDPSSVVGRPYWQQTVTVAANTNYEFSAWFMVIEEDPALVFQIDGMPIGPSFNLNRLTGGSNGPDAWQQYSIHWNSGSMSGPVTLELLNLTAGCDGNDIRIDDISLRSKSTSCDADNDGIANHLDLDSDNDGIYDLIEAGHAATDANNDGIIDGSPSVFGTNGLFDGIETFADSDVIDYTISDSESTSDGIYDAYEIDSDGDGCFDTNEELIADSEDDGTAGTGMPTVLENGLISSLTYAAPTRNQWQNHAVGICLPEDCINGVDDDGDGAIDCVDEDCPSATPVTRVNRL